MSVREAKKLLREHGYNEFWGSYADTRKGYTRHKLGILTDTPWDALDLVRSLYPDARVWRKFSSGRGIDVVWTEPTTPRPPNPVYQEQAYQRLLQEKRQAEIAAQEAHDKAFLTRFPPVEDEEGLALSERLTLREVALRLEGGSLFDELLPPSEDATEELRRAEARMSENQRQRATFRRLFRRALKREQNE